VNQQESIGVPAQVKGSDALPIHRSINSAFRVQVLGLFLLILFLAPRSSAQSAPPMYVRNNSFGILAAYSNDSSHIFVGLAEQRKLFHIGVSYTRKLIAGRIVNWQFDAELLPVALENNPLTRSVNVQTSPTQSTSVVDGLPPLITCAPLVIPYNFTVGTVDYIGTDTLTCHGHQWIIGEAMSPFGMQFNFLPRRRLQPLIETHGGYMYSTHPIPIVNAGNFNFTADAGIGFEYFRTRRQSIRVEYRYHHISDADTSFFNPGIDNGVVQVAWVFGR
jgi:hypothetical protein